VFNTARALYVETAKLKKGGSHADCRYTTRENASQGCDERLAGIGKTARMETYGFG